MKWHLYVIHFDTKYKHAGHYTGIAINPTERFEAHCKGRGARLTEIAAGNNINMRISILKSFNGFSKAHKEEKRHKNLGGARRYCPICKKGI